MNLVDEVLGQLSGEAMSKLGAALNVDEQTAERAAGAAVPSLLSAMAGMMSSDAGAKQLTDMLGKVDISSLGNISRMLSGDGDSHRDAGSNMLNSLFGESMSANLADVVSHYTGISEDVIKRLLCYLTPLVLGRVTAQWKSLGGTAQSLRNLFAEQSEEIDNALPAGLSIDDITGLADAGEAVSSAGRMATSEKATAGASAGWILPLAVVLLGAFLFWQLKPGPSDEQIAADDPIETADEVTVFKPVVSEDADQAVLDSARDSLNDLFTLLTTTFSSIQDQTSAEGMMPTLEDLDIKVDAMTEMLSNLPESTFAELQPMLDEKIGLAVDEGSAVSSMAGINTEARELIQQITDKMANWIAEDN